MERAALILDKAQQLSKSVRQGKRLSSKSYRWLRRSIVDSFWRREFNMGVADTIDWKVYTLKKELDTLIADLDIDISKLSELDR